MKEQKMKGMITERNWKAIEKTFPGLHFFYSRLPRKPRTFLELLELYRIYKVFTARGSLENETPGYEGVALRVGG